LNKNNCNYDHLKFKDHYNYSKYDLKNISESEIILTTEKDFVKLSTIFKDRPIYYLPIQIKLHSKEKFDNLILNYCDN
jgi:tetraacyldisaccharide 4'-kinase